MRRESVQFSGQYIILTLLDQKKKKKKKADRKTENKQAIKKLNSVHPCPSEKRKNKIPKLQALVYDILPPTSATVDYAIGLEKLSSNGQFLMMLKWQ